MMRSIEQLRLETLVLIWISGIRERDTDKGHG